LGQLIDKLKERGLYENTIIVVFTDHGDYAGDYGMIEKFLAGFEDCLLWAPLILCGPGISPGKPCDALREMTDLYPTLMELVGLEPKHYHYGRSLVPLMEGSTDAHRDAVFAEGGYHADEAQFRVHIPEGSAYWLMRQINLDTAAARKAAMVRTQTHKYVYCPGDRDELYDLVTDPHEINNLEDSEEHQAIRAELRERMMRWMLDTGDVLPLEQDPRGWRPR
jgi:arylsulfatase A-like enzyme